MFGLIWILSNSGVGGKNKNGKKKPGMGGGGGRKMKGMQRARQSRAGKMYLEMTVAHSITMYAHTLLL